MKISELILSGNLLEAKKVVTERLNEMALNLLDSIKGAYAKDLFSEDFDANKFKGKTDMDALKDQKAAGDEGEDMADVPDKEEGEEEDENGDDGEAPENGDEADDEKAKTVKAGSKGNVTINVKEGVIPVAHGKPGTDSVGKGAAENPSWKKKQKSLMAMKAALNKTATTAIVSEEQNGENQGAKGNGAGKAYTKALNKKMPAKAKVDSVVKEENLQELSKATLSRYVKRASNDAAINAMQSEQPNTDWKVQNRHSKKASKRLDGVRTAADKLSK